MFYFSIAIVIISNVFYTIFSYIIPHNANPLIALCCMYLAGFILALIFYYSSKDRSEEKRERKRFNWRIIAFALTNIIIEYGFMMAFRYGWDMGITNTITNIISLILLMLIGTFFLREKLTFINIIGIVLGTIGVACIGF